jgi:hypothetical protein
MQAIAIFSLVAGVSAMNSAANAQRDASAAAEKRFQVSEQKAQVQNVRAVRGLIRQRRIQQASMLNQAAASGGIGGSGYAGGRSAAMAQSTGAISSMAQIANYNTQMGQYSLQESNSLAQAQIYGSMGNMFMGMFNSAGGFQTALGA